MEYYAPLFFNQMATLFEYLPADTKTVRVGALHQALEQFWTDVRVRFENLRHDRRKPLLSPEKLFVRTEELFADLNRFSSIEIKEPDSMHPRIRPLPDVTFDAKADQPATRLNALIDNIKAVCFVAESAGRREALSELLARHGIVQKPSNGSATSSRPLTKRLLRLAYWTRGS